MCFLRPILRTREVVEARCQDQYALSVRLNVDRGNKDSTEEGGTRIDRYSADNENDGIM